jgi:type I restriction enzyme S subunit
VAANRKIRRLVEVCVPNEGIQTGPFGSQLHSADYVEVGTPIITVEHLGENSIEGKNPPLVSADDVKRLSKYTLKEGDIVFSRVGSVDRRALVSADQDGWMFSGRLLRVRPEPELADPTYLSYFFGLPIFKTYIRSIAVGATMPSLNTGLLSDIPVILPDMAEQVAIGKLFRALDARIKINRAIVKSLEDMTQAIFNSWFIDFDPVTSKIAGEKPFGMDDETASLFPDHIESFEGEQIPAGWKMGVIGDICASVVNGSTPLRSKSEFWDQADLAWFKTGELSDDFLFDSKESISFLALKQTSVKTLPKGSVLMAIYAAPTVGRLGILTKESTFNQACTGMTPKVEFGTAYLYLTLYNRRVWFNSLAIGAAQQNISKAIVENCPAIIAPLAVHEAFRKVTTPFFSQMETLSAQNMSLAKIRDQLLPRLISGELQIPEEMMAG